MYLMCVSQDKPPNANYPFPSIVMSTSETLMAKYKDLIYRTATHPLPQELCTGKLPGRVLFIYLAQDLQFFQAALRLSCRATSLAPNECLIKRAQHIGMFAHDEHPFFHECEKLLAKDVNTEERTFYTQHELNGTHQFIMYMQRMLSSEHTSYAQFVAFGFASELIYLLWPQLNKRSYVNLDWMSRRWIELHEGPEFEDWCEFFKQEFDKCQCHEVEQVFADVLKMEFDFFECCYNAGNLTSNLC